MELRVTTLAQGNLRIADDIACDILKEGSSESRPKHNSACEYKHFLLYETEPECVKYT